MLFIILYNSMVVSITILMIVAAFKIKRTWKWFFSPILLIVAMTVFVIPNIDYIKSPFAAPYKVVVTEGGKPLDGVTVITARGLKFNSFFAHIPDVIWKDVGIGVTNTKGEIAFGKRIKFMNINMGWFAQWNDYNKTLLIGTKQAFEYYGKIVDSKEIHFMALAKLDQSIDYDRLRREIDLDIKHIIRHFSAKAKNEVRMYYDNMLREVKQKY